MARVKKSLNREIDWILEIIGFPHWILDAKNTWLRHTIHIKSDIEISKSDIIRLI